MKNKRIAAPLIIPAELRLEEFATYFSALAEWVRQDPKNLAAVFSDYRADTKSADSAPARSRFISHLFFECKAGLDYLAVLQRNRLSQPTLAKAN